MKLSAHLFFIILLLSLNGMGQQKPVDTDQYQEQIRVACIGNTVSKMDMSKRYPALLQQKLGQKFRVEDFTVDDVTLLIKGHNPYKATERFQKAIDFNPHVVIINLGLFDTGLKDWKIYQDDFTRDYLGLLEAFEKLDTKPKIWLCKMTPIFSQYPDFKAGVGESFWEIQEAIALVAKVSGKGIIDLHEPLYSRPDLFEDFIHTNELGEAIVAKKVFSAITGDYGGLAVPEIFGSHMVLQRDRPVRIWGQANYGQEVEVSLVKQKQLVRADAQGRWEAEFAAMSAGGPYEISITADDKTIRFDDVLIGEVWVCSGQSNMDFRTELTQGAEDVLTQADYPEIRLMSMKSADKTITTHWEEELLNQMNEHHYRYEPWERCTPKSAADFSGVGFYFGIKIYGELGIPIGLIDNSKGGSPTESWVDRKSLEQNPGVVDIMDDWKQNEMIQQWCRDRAIFNCQNASSPLQRHPYEPAYLYETLVNPLIHYPIKGVIWYQGEANANNTELHEELFSTLVKSWRENWGAEMPFYYVQLSSFNDPGWPRFRDSQRRLMDTIPNSGMAVSSDVGDSLDIHPPAKREVGERLALWALAKNYHKEVVFSGPLFSSVQRVGQKVLIEFKHSNGLRAADHLPLRTFELAGEDRVFKAAEARIVGNKVEVFSEEISNPQYVRYGWQPFTRANLINETGLPASTFSGSI